MSSPGPIRCSANGTNYEMQGWPRPWLVQVSKTQLDAVVIEWSRGGNIVTASPGARPTDWTIY